MEREERWNQFATTGRITDYLSYKGCLNQVVQQEEAEGNNKDERTYNADRNDINSISHERVR